MKTSVLLSRLLACGALSLCLLLAPHVNADQQSTLIFVGNDAGDRYVLQSDIDGTFGMIDFLHTIGSYNRGGATGDIDGDGDLDLVGCNSLNDTCYRYEQTAPRTFENMQTIFSGIPLNLIEHGTIIMDVELDGDLDVIAAGNTGYLRILYNDGMGFFPTAANVQAPFLSAVRGTDSSDINGDGYEDMVVSFKSSGRVYLYQNNKAGGFLPSVLLFDTLGLSNEPYALSAADFDGDGFIDIAAGGSIDGNVSLWKGNGAGAFTAAGTIFGFGGQTAIENFDFDNDGDQDLVAVTHLTGEVRYLANNGDGTFAAPITIATVPAPALGLAVQSAPPVLSRLSGIAFPDANINGVNDDGLGGVADVELSLTGTDYRGRAVNRSTTTASDGSYAFGDLPISDAAGYALDVVSGGDASVTLPITVIIPKANTHAAQDIGFVPCTDNDGDGFAIEGEACGPIDCDDTNPAINPDATEICNGVDDNCDELTDEGFDQDADSFTTCGGDCNDTDPLVNPAAAEECNGIDDNCNGTADEGYDADSDGVTVCGGDCNDDDPAVNPNVAEQCNFIDDDCDMLVDEGFDQDEDGYVICANDCDENDPLINPGAEEVCDGLDNNCNEAVDEGFDEDNDGFTICQNDCNDAEPDVNPSIMEVCNGVDDNCDGNVDEGFDQDEDGFTTCGGDSDDTNPLVNPGMDELCNGYDDDSDGEIDEGYDADGDGVTSCGGDCNDSDASINPSATEECNGVDDNCNGNIDEGFDEDGDGFTSCGGDCNDTVQVGTDATITIEITDIVSTGAGADMTADIFVGTASEPAGNGTVTIPLTVHGVPIIDPSSSSDVPGLHVVRGIDDGKAFVRINAYGHNATATREQAIGTVALNGATVSLVQNGPNGPYEKQGDGLCTGQPGNDEYEIPLGGGAGTFCTTTNVSSDNVTIGYRVSSRLFCNAISNPETQCSDPRFAPCGVCIHPGADDPFGDGIDNDCGGEPDCGMKTDYESDVCQGTVRVNSDTELEAYLQDFGYENGKYKDLRIVYDIEKPFVDIHSPCRIFIKTKKTIEGDAICIDGRKGVRINPHTKLAAGNIVLLSERGTVWMTAKTSVRAVMRLLVTAAKKVIVGSQATIAGQSDAQLLATGSQGRVVVNTKASVTAKNLTIEAGNRARLGSKSETTVAELFSMDAPQCFIHNKAEIDAGSTAGSCFASPSGSDDGDEGDDELNDTEDEGL